nr:putative ribonuclease H-like domain-containing protein [Tanacetum cinerariifolium]
DSGCSRHMTGNMSYLSDFEELNGGYVIFGGNPRGDSLLPIPFWAKAVNTACYVQNRMLKTDGDVAFDGKEPKFDEKKPESKVNVSPSSCAQSRKQDEKTNKEAKGKKFEDYSDNSINEVNAAGTLVPIVG